MVADTSNASLRLSTSRNTTLENLEDAHLRRDSTDTEKHHTSRESSNGAAGSSEVLKDVFKEEKTYRNSSSVNLEDGPSESGRIIDPNIVDWDGPNDPENPLNWPVQKRVAHIVFASGSCLMVYVQCCSFLLSLFMLISRQEFGFDHVCTGSVSCHE